MSKGKAIAQGIADAIAGGLTAGFTQQSGVDTFGPFMQSIQARVARQEQVDGRAYNSFNESVRGVRGAALSDPIKYEGVISSRMSQLLEQANSVEDPNLRQAALNGLEALESEYAVSLSNAHRTRNVQDGLRGNFGWATEGTPESNDALSQLFSPDAELGKRFARAAALHANLGGGTGADLNLGDLPDSANTTEMRQLLAMVGEVDGGPVQFAADNPEKAKRLGELLARTDLTALDNTEKALTEVRDENNILLRMNSLVSSNPDLGGLEGIVDRNLIARDERGGYAFDERSVGFVAGEALKAFDGNASLALASMRTTFGKVPGFDIGNITRAISQGGRALEIAPADTSRLINGSFEAGKELMDAGIPRLSRQDQQRVFQGDIAPLVESGLSREAAQQILPLFQGRGDELIFRPVMQAALGDDETWEARLSNAQAALEQSVEQYGPESAITQTAAAKVKQIADLQSRPALRAGVESLTRQTLVAAESGDWESLAASFAVGTEAANLLSPDGLNSSAKDALATAINENAPLSVQLRQFKSWALGAGIVFRTGQPGAQATSDANAEAADLYAKVIDHWAGVLDSEQRTLSTEAGNFMGLDSNDPFRPQRAVLRMATISDVSELNRPNNQIGGTVFTKQGMEDAGLTTLGMPTVLGSTSGKF
jgi:hypothetical protein